MKKKEFIITAISAIIVINIVGFILNQMKENKLSDNTKTTFGVYEREIKSAYSGSVYLFIYRVNDSEYNIKEDFIEGDLSKGDTVLIEYSNDDPSIARVTDFHYNNKTK